jgi:hypothetical protein
MISDRRIVVERLPSQPNSKSVSFDIGFDGEWVDKQIWGTKPPLTQQAAELVCTQLASFFGTEIKLTELSNMHMKLETKEGVPAHQFLMGVIQQREEIAAQAEERAGHSL